MTLVAGLRWLHMLECYSSPACFFLHCFELRGGSYLSGFISFKFDQYWDAITQNVLLWVVKLHPIPGYEDWMRRLQTSGGYSIINFWCHGFAEGEHFFFSKEHFPEMWEAVGYPKILGLILIFPTSMVRWAMPHFQTDACHTEALIVGHL